MIKFKANNLRHDKFTSVLTDSSGEHQLIIVAVWRQDWTCALTVLRVAVDGQVENVLVGKYTAAQCFKQLEKAARTWAAIGTRPLVKQQKKIDKQVKKLVAQFHVHWHV